MYIRSLSITLLQIFCKIILDLGVIVKSIKDPDDNFEKNEQREVSQSMRTNPTKVDKM